MKNPLTLLFAIAMASCAAPKAVVVEETPVKPVSNAVADNTPPAVPGVPDDGLREPDMLALPSDELLRRSPAPSGDGGSPVTLRPPKE